MERARESGLLAVEPDCCYKEQRQRECLLKTQSPHSCGRTHAISLHGSHFSCVPLLVEEYVRNEVEERLSQSINQYADAVLQIQWESMGLH